MLILGVQRQNHISFCLEALSQTEYDSRICAEDEDICTYHDIVNGEDIYEDFPGVFI